MAESCALRRLGRQPLPALGLVQPTPDTVRLANAERVAEAILTNRTALTDRLGPALTIELFFFAFEAWWRKENRCLRPPASSFQLPRFLPTLQPTPSPLFTLDPSPASRRATRKMWL